MSLHAFHKNRPAQCNCALGWVTSTLVFWQRIGKRLYYNGFRSCAHFLRISDMKLLLNWTCNNVSSQWTGQFIYNFLTCKTTSTSRDVTLLCKWETFKVMRGLTSYRRICRSNICCTRASHSTQTVARNHSSEFGVHA